MMKVTRGLKARPFSIVMYGPPGVGKTTWAAGAPSPLIIDPNGRTARVDVMARVDVASMAEVNEVLDAVESGDIDCETIILDELATVESYMQTDVLKGKKEKFISDIPWGKGPDAVVPMMRNLIARLEQTEKNIIIIGHSKVSRFKNPEGDDYDRFGLDVHHKVQAILEQWAEGVLFARVQNFSDTKDGGKTIGLTGERVIHVEGQAAYRAKNSWQIVKPLKMDSFDEFHRHVRACDMGIDALREQLSDSKHYEETATVGQLRRLYVHEAGS